MTRKANNESVVLATKAKPSQRRGKKSAAQPEAKSVVRKSTTDVRGTTAGRKRTTRVSKPVASSRGANDAPRKRGRPPKSATSDTRQRRAGSKPQKINVNVTSREERLSIRYPLELEPLFSRKQWALAAVAAIVLGLLAAKAVQVAAS